VSHPRTDVSKRLATVVTGIPGIKSVLRSRVWPTDKKKLPVVCVYLPAEALKVHGGGGPGRRRTERSMSARIVGIFETPVLAGTDFEDQVDNLVGQVEGRVAADPHLKCGIDGGVARDTVLRSVTTGFDASGSGDVVVVAIDFTVTVDHREGDPAHPFIRS
jgi:hypothetical protein